MSNLKSSIEMELELHYKFMSLKGNGNINIDGIEEQFTKINFKNGKNYSNLLKSAYYLKIKNFSQAKQLSGLLINSTNISDLIKAEAFNILGIIARLHKLFPEAIVFYEKSELHFKSLNSNVGRIGSLRVKFNTANTYLIKSDLKKALSIYNDIIVDINNLDDQAKKTEQINKILVKSYQNQAISYMYLGEFTESEIFFKLAVKITKVLKNKNIIADLYVNYATLSRTLGNVDETLTFLKNAIRIYRELNNESLYSKVYIDITREEIIYNKIDSIEPEFTEKLVFNYEKAIGKDINLRIVEIIEKLRDNEHINIKKLIDEVLKFERFEPDLKGKIIYIKCEIEFRHENYENVLALGKIVEEIAFKLDDKISGLAIKALLTHSKFMLENNISELKTNVEEILEGFKSFKDYNGVIETCESFIGIFWEDNSIEFIIKLLEKYEKPSLKKLKNQHFMDIHLADIILLNAVHKNKTALKIFKKKFNNIEEILSISRFGNSFQKNQKYLKNLEEILGIAR